MLYVVYFHNNKVKCTIGSYIHINIYIYIIYITRVEKA